MINPFFGELFMYPIPLELSHNYCSNKCAYCFANLNKPNRVAEVSKVANLLKKYNQKTDITSILLQNKQAICISNKTDPFATSNYKIAIPEIKTLTDLEIPIAYHTRGGKHFDEFYNQNKIPKSLFYISICQTDELIRKLIEPGATSLEYRWGMAKMLLQDGHQVVIGLNPFVQEWIDVEKYIKSILDVSVKNVLIQPLHLNGEQIKNMSEKECDNITNAVLNNAKKRDSPYTYSIKQLIKRLIGLGVNAFDTQNFNESDIMSAWHTGLNGATFKTLYDFYHWCRKNKANNSALFFEDFYGFIKPEIFEEEKSYQFYQYITSVDRSYRKTRISGKSIKSKMTFKELCFLVWNDHSGVKNLSRNENFAMVGEIKNSQMELVMDDNDNLIYSFSSKPFDYRLINEELVNF